MTIKFYTGFSKRINSTKRPTGNAQLTLEGDLRDATSVEKPVIKIKNMGATSPTPYIYAYIEKFSRYYFVSDWVYETGFWYCHLTEDYLASWKTYIGSTNAYIDRASSQYDGNIIDTRYTTKTDYVQQSVIMNSDYYEYNIHGGTFILGVIDSNNETDSQAGGAVTYYVLTPAQCKALVHYLLSDDFLNYAGFPQVTTIAQDLSHETAKAFIKPMDFIVSCMWYPMPVSAFTNASDIQITVGYWQIATSIATGKLLQAICTTGFVYATLPSHPQAETRGNYLNFAPYSRMSVEIPPFGLIPIDLSYRTQGNVLIGIYYIDTMTGMATMTLHLKEAMQGALPYDGVIVGEASAMMGVPVNLSQVNGNYLGAISEGVQAIASVDLLGGAIGMMTGGVGGALKGAINSDVISHAANAINALAPQVRTSGVDGSRLYTKIRPRINAQFTKLVDEDLEEIGRPLLQKKVINTLSGYVKCFEVTVDYPCFDNEKDIILQYLTHGFFWE